MTVELDIVERKNEENLKHTIQIPDTMKKLILDENDPIASMTPTIAETNSEITHANNTTSTQTDIQRFYSGKSIFITGGTGINRTQFTKSYREKKWLRFFGTSLIFAHFNNNVVHHSWKFKKTHFFPSEIVSRFDVHVYVVIQQNQQMFFLCVCYNYDHLLVFIDWTGGQWTAIKIVL